jgi:hypothetical protein
MRDGIINGKFKQIVDSINMLSQQQQSMAYSIQNVLDSYRADIVNMFLYNKAVQEYEEKFWFIPRGMYPFGRKTFSKIHQRIINDHKEKERKQKEEYMQKLKEAKENAKQKQDNITTDKPE